MEFIDLKSQYQAYKKEIDLAIQDVLDSASFIMGDKVTTLESELSRFVGVKHSIGVSSGTDSLQIALMALGIGSGDEVITVPFTFISTAEVIRVIGATPVFIDIENDTMNMDVNKLEQAITPKTKAIIPVNLFGQLPDYDTINAIANKYNIPVIEDAAQSIGATQNGKQSGGLTTIGSTSFFPAKPLGCYGDGGALFTNDDQLAHKMKEIRVHGGVNRHEYNCIGINGRLDAMQAAILSVKLSHFQKEVDLRQQIGARYTDLLQGVCETPKVQEGNTHIYAIYTIRVPNRDAIAKALSDKGIPNGVYYPKGLHEQPAFADLGYTNAHFPVCHQACQEVLSLPMHAWLTEEQQDFIVQTLKDALLVKAGG